LVYLLLSYLIMSTPSVQLLVTAPQLGQLLKAARKRQKLTQLALGARLGLSQNRVSYLEQHADDMSFKQLLAWCAVVGLDLHIAVRQPVQPSTQGEW
jgi:HTH-type transcriptional regulator/antitoxin HipB